MFVAAGRSGSLCQPPFPHNQQQAAGSRRIKVLNAKKKKRGGWLTKNRIKVTLGQIKARYSQKAVSKHKTSTVLLREWLRHRHLHAPPPSGPTLPIHAATPPHPAHSPPPRAAASLTHFAFCTSGGSEQSCLSSPQNKAVGRGTAEPAGHSATARPLGYKPSAF